jgi:hypothetical protein
MVLRLVKSDLHPTTEQRIIRASLDIRLMSEMSVPELRAVYCEIAAMAGRLYQLLERVDKDDQH